MLRTLHFGATLLLLVCAGCAGTVREGDGNDPGDPTSASPTTITLKRLDALGFCVEPNQFTDVSITRNDAGERVLAGTVFVRDATGEPSCTSTCYVTRDAGPLILSDAESRELDSLVANVTVAMKASGADTPDDCVGRRDPGCDPCLIQELAVDGVSHTDDPCTAFVCTGYQARVEAVERYIDGLVPPVE